MLTSEDREIWKLVTDNVATPVFRPSATAILPYAGRRGFLLDLHGLTVSQAHTHCREFVAQNYLRRTKYVTIITGLSGIIRREFPRWVEFMPEVRRAETLNGGGAFKLYLKRQ